MPACIKLTLTPQVQDVPKAKGNVGAWGNAHITGSKGHRHWIMPF